MGGNFVLASDLFNSWREALTSCEKPITFPCDLPIELEPGRITLIGGAPGSGKTALTMQIVVDALRLNPDLRAAICNVEMPPQVLMERQLSRFSGISATTIRNREFDERHGERLESAFTIFYEFIERLCFVRPPVTLENLAASADVFNAELIVLDYVQRISPPGESRDKRGALDATMSFLRQFADAGVAVLIVSSVSRQRDGRGRATYDDLSLASFRESAELEFGADDAYVIQPSDFEVVVKHLKSRHGELSDLHLQWQPNVQRFEVTNDIGEAENDFGN
jgi:replicative DNA helicase